MSKHATLRYGFGHFLGSACNNKDVTACIDGITTATTSMKCSSETMQASTASNESMNLTNQHSSCIASGKKEDK